jgi:glycerol-3-phosphate dehydrogenase
MRDLQAIQNTTYDLIVIGGGINGAGVARDAALRGLKTILIEKRGFCQRNLQLVNSTGSWRVAVSGIF